MLIFFFPSLRTHSLSQLPCADFSFFCQRFSLHQCPRHHPMQDAAATSTRCGLKTLPRPPGQCWIRHHVSHQTHTDACSYLNSPRLRNALTCKRTSLLFKKSQLLTHFLPSLVSLSTTALGNGNAVTMKTGILASTTWPSRSTHSAAHSWPECVVCKPSNSGSCARRAVLAHPPSGNTSCKASQSTPSA